MGQMPRTPIEYVLPSDRDAKGTPKPGAAVWTLLPQNWRAAKGRTTRHLLALKHVDGNDAAAETLFLQQQLEHFTDVVVGHRIAGETAAPTTDKVALAQLAEDLDLGAFDVLLAAASSPGEMKAGALNWPGSSSNGAATPATQEPTPSTTLSTATSGNASAPIMPPTSVSGAGA